MFNKQLPSVLKKIAEILQHICITGVAGIGKSHVVRVIYQSLKKTLILNSDNLKRVLLLAPTGVATVNIIEQQ